MKHFSSRNCNAGLCAAPEVFAQQSCEILRVCHVQRTSKKMLRISDVSWWDQDRQAEPWSLTVPVSLPPAMLPYPSISPKRKSFIDSLCSFLTIWVQEPVNWDLLCYRWVNIQSCVFLTGYVGKLSAAGQLYMEHTASKIDALHTENDTSNKWKLHDGYPIECIKTESQVQ